MKIFIVIILVVITPILLNILISFETPYTVGNSSTWLSFFGSYIGAIIGGLVAYYVAKMQFERLDKKEENKRNLRQYPLLLEIRSEVLRVLNQLKTFEHTLDSETNFSNQIEFNFEPLNATVWNNVKEVEFINLMTELFEIKSFYENLKEVASLELQPLYVESSDLQEYINSLEGTKVFAEEEGGNLLRKDEINLKKSWNKYEVLSKQIKEIELRKKSLFQEYREKEFYRSVVLIIDSINEKIQEIESDSSEKNELML